MFKCPNCGSENIDHCYSSDEVEIWCEDCGNRDRYDLPRISEAFPNWCDNDNEEYL